MNLGSFVGLKDASVINCLDKFFLSAKISEGIKTFVVYHLRTGKATDLVGNFQETSPGTTWSKLWAETLHGKQIAQKHYSNYRPSEY